MNKKIDLTPEEKQRLVQFFEILIEWDQEDKAKLALQRKQELEEKELNENHTDEQSSIVGRSNDGGQHDACQR